MADIQIPESMIERLGHLLAESPIDEKIKQEILDHLDKIPDYMIVGLLDALEAERSQLKTLDFELNMLKDEAAKDAQEVQQNYTKIANSLAEKWARKIADEQKLKQLQSQVSSS